MCSADGPTGPTGRLRVMLMNSEASADWLTVGVAAAREGMDLGCVRMCTERSVHYKIILLEFPNTSFIEVQGF